jgi:sterol desaturase/sphingolipid hydroxylase (fatty acid hydroxylase superfamily)
MSLRNALDYAVWPLLLGGSVWAAHAMLELGLPPLGVTPVVVMAFLAVVAVLERIRPERSDYSAPDQPLWIEAAHFVFSFELGYGAALLLCEVFSGAARAAVALPAWPSQAPGALQLALAVLLYEGTSYWQHRLIHHIPWLWRFHALHHSGTRLNFLRTARFHAIDIGSAAFVAYLPLVLLGAPDRLFTVLGVLLSALGVLQHANVRMRTPRWLDWLVCTPAVHRHHHSRARRENDSNFGNTVMIFDVLFGTFGRPRPAGPVFVGIENDRVAAGFWGQVFPQPRR